MKYFRAPLYVGEQTGGPEQPAHVAPGRAGQEGTEPAVFPGTNCVLVDRDSGVAYVRALPAARFRTPEDWEVVERAVVVAEFRRILARDPTPSEV